MAQNENTPSATRRFWRGAYLASLAAFVAAMSPPMLACVAAVYVGGIVVRCLWSLRA